MDILHCDLNNFFASVEQVMDPSLNGKFVAVCGDPEKRSGIVLAKNTAAKNMGVKTGDAIWQARQKCPQLVCVAPHYDWYGHYSERVRQIYCRYTDLVECFGMDECWLDVTHSKIFGTPMQIAEEIRQTVKKETGLTVSIGVSFTKTFAKLGSDLKKPDAVTEISRKNYRKVVWSLPVEEMLFVGRQTKNALNQMGIFTLGQLAEANDKVLTSKFGINGLKLKHAARGEDEDAVSSVNDERQIKSIGHGTTTIRDMVTYAEAEQTIFMLSDMVATRLRNKGFCAGTVHLDIRHNDLTHTSKQCKIVPTFIAANVYHAAVRLLHAMWCGNASDPLRSLTVQVSNLTFSCGGVQTSIFDANDEKHSRLQFCVDKIRKKFGYDAITCANMLKCDFLSGKTFSTDESTLPFKRG